MASIRNLRVGMGDGGGGEEDTWQRQGRCKFEISFHLRRHAFWEKDKADMGRGYPREVVVSFSYLLRLILTKDMD